MFLQLMLEQELSNIDFSFLNCSAFPDVILLLLSVYFAFGALGGLFLLCEGGVERALAPVLLFR